MRNPKFEARNPKQYQTQKTQNLKPFWSFRFEILNLFKISDLEFRVFLKEGFTLMEMLIVIGIMTMMTLIYTANFHGFQQGLAVESDTDGIATSLRQMQLWALTGELIEGVLPDGGYGFAVNAPCTTGACAYTVFGDTCNPATHVYDSGCDLIVKTETLNAQVNVTSVDPASPLSIVFTFPTAAPYVNGNAGANGAVTLTHRADAAYTKTISVDGVSGQISIQ